MTMVAKQLSSRIEENYYAKANVCAESAGSWKLRAPKSRYKSSAIIAVGVITLGFVVCLLLVTAMKTARSRRLVIDVAIGFIGSELPAKLLGKKLDREPLRTPERNKVSFTCVSVLNSL